ncbi:MAG: bifunctional anthranilate synthase component II/anthranilate phosphoribosyltransferase [Spirochaetales bacterium]|nr:bifunctional anthranilate synthase component II/anthranilate phosphoribosyltransferase [Spirochaetales bacterium]
MYLIIDNYDSFTYNLYQYICELTPEPVEVFRNDKINIKKIESLNPKAIIISPGPGTPLDAGISVDMVKHFAGKIPILGVCLGHQCIGAAFGAEIVSAKRIVHGKVESMSLDGRGLFRNLPKKSDFTRYHSLAIKKGTLPPEFEITAYADDGEIMGIRHKQYAVEGVQFHPESIASEFGKRLLNNFLYYHREPYPIKEMLSKLTRLEALSFEQAQGFMEELTEGNLNNSQVAGFLIALNCKGYTSEEIAGFASVLKKKKVPLPTKQSAIDMCGTGGDGLGTFNISSFAALVVAACGVPVAKHGNRAVSSLCGSADFYKELGITIDLKPDAACRLLEQTNFCFLFAPAYHGAMKHAVPVRKELGMKTIMNLIGPLSNPAEAKMQLIGIYAKDLCKSEAQAAHMLGVKNVMVVHGLDGVDEVSVSGPTHIVEVNEKGDDREYLFQPEEVGIKLYTQEELLGGDAMRNVQLAREILDGKGKEAIRDCVLLNAGAALYISKTAESIKAGYEIAKDALDSGKVKSTLETIIKVSKELS